MAADLHAEWIRDFQGRPATLFPKEASLLRLASAVLSEISDDWETDQAYLNMEAR